MAGEGPPTTTFDVESEGVDGGPAATTTVVGRPGGVGRFAGGATLAGCATLTGMPGLAEDAILTAATMPKGVLNPPRHHPVV